MLLSVFGFAQHGQGQHQHGGPGTTELRLRLMQQIIVLLQKQVTTTTIKQTGDKHVSEVTQDGLNYGFGGYKNRSICYQSGENQKQ
jgi:hypothetical protein